LSSTRRNNDLCSLVPAWRLTRCHLRRGWGNPDWNIRPTCSQKTIHAAPLCGWQGTGLSANGLVICCWHAPFRAEPFKG